MAPLETKYDVDARIRARASVPEYFSFKSISFRNARYFVVCVSRRFEIPREIRSIEDAYYYHTTDGRATEF